jgi:hypothetical protein
VSFGRREIVKVEADPSIYEFIQRRSDWKKIEKTVDKAMYALSVRDDCVIM